MKTNLSEGTVTASTHSLQSLPFLSNSLLPPTRASPSSLCLVARFSARKWVKSRNWKFQSRILLDSQNCASPSNWGALSLPHLRNKTNKYLFHPGLWNERNWDEMRIENRTVCVRPSPFSLAYEQYNEPQVCQPPAGVIATPVLPKSRRGTRNA